MPRPLREPTAHERAQFDIIRDLGRTVSKNDERNRLLLKDRQERIRQLIDDGWSMYGIALHIGLSPNTLARLLTRRYADSSPTRVAG